MENLTLVFTKLDPSVLSTTKPPRSEARADAGAGAGAGAGMRVSLHPQAVAALEEARRAPAVHTLDAAGIRARRAAGREDALAEPKEDVAAALDVDADGVPCRLVRPAGSDPDALAAALLYLHGGGFVLRRPRDPRRPGPPPGQPQRRAVLAVDYLRPPEHPFPAALVDSVTALDWLVAHAADRGVDGQHVAVIGDSAGANLGIGTSLRRPGRLEAAVLVYPFLDPEAGSASVRLDAVEAGPRRRAGSGGTTWWWAQRLRPRPRPRGRAPALHAARRAAATWSRSPERTRWSTRTWCSWCAPATRR